MYKKISCYSSTSVLVAIICFDMMITISSEHSFFHILIHEGDPKYNSSCGDSINGTKSFNFDKYIFISAFSPSPRCGGWRLIRPFGFIAGIEAPVWQTAVSDFILEMMALRSLSRILAAVFLTQLLLYEL
uniref:Uncharacterized protein n=1 Tax=Glossina brevipalpis TaxID=37001 RepID=A0A1A9WHC8_9MUSC